MAHYSFISIKYRRNAKLALITFALAFVVILLGAYTRLTNAGLSCPDWPHCYGFITAPHTVEQIQAALQKYPLAPVDVKKAWTEMTHRYAAGTEGLLILVLACSILFNRKNKDFKSNCIGIGLIGILIVQVMLGMLTVTAKLKPIIVLSHLLAGLSLLSLLWWAYLDLHLRDDHVFLQKNQGATFKPWLTLGLIIIVLQITLGGWVSSHYAGLACIDFPYCNGNLMPTLQWQHYDSDLITIHMLHRFGAYITACYLSILSLFLLRSHHFKIIGGVIIFLIGTQITLGVLNIIWLRPVYIALLHHATAILLLLTLITALVKSALITDHRHGFFS